MSKACGLGEFDGGAIRCGEGDVGRLTENDPEPGDQRRKAARGFVDEGVPLDALKCVG